MIVGTAGHIDHGKTSLVRALTGVDTDRLKEEKARGISIDLGFAYLPAADGSVLGFVDVPGHERFVHTMLAGASGIDFVLFVIAADDGVMPQTREHLAIVDLLGVTRGIVALTKADLASPDRRAQVAAGIAETLSSTNLAGSPIIPVSTVTGEGIEALREALLTASSAAGRRGAAGRFRLAVDRSFTLAGTGTVVTGTALSGRVVVGDRVLVSPAGLPARVRSIHAQNRPVEQGEAGDRCALNLAGEGISKDAIRRGDMILDPSLHAPSDRIDAILRLLPSEAKAVGQWSPVRLHHAAAEVGAHVVLLEEEPLVPGGEKKVQLVLEKPIAAAVGDRFVLRDPSARRTIGGGRFLDLRAPARKRRTSARLAQLEAMAIEDPMQALAALLEREPRHVDLSAFARDRALAEAEMQSLVDALGIVKLAAKDRVIGLSAATWEQLKRALLALLENFHQVNPDLPGIGLERLRLQLEPRLPAPAFAAGLVSLARAGELALDGAWVRLPGHQVRLTPEEEQLWAGVAPLLAGEARFRPPRVRDIGTLLAVPEEDVRRLAKLMARMGKVSEVAHDHFFLRDTVAEMVRIAVAIAAASEKGEFTAAQFRDQVNNGRKVAIQILEFFDRHGVTLRRGDLRRMNKHQLDLFRPSAETPAPATATSDQGREASPVGRPDFKSGWGREPALGGFDSHSLPPVSREAR
ncbi:selenocysteine-specific translation factor [Hypericibacter adhaerens]|uniref:Selenocysteine-specific elongation factor n=1 Tax=Hypericibacter adhaerens TaxID=2602016 RepID=A0A5J6MZ51_9PROT|nr:selenocysteine-specific translation factor [Hypericibacter adhaerens]